MDFKEKMSRKATVEKVAYAVTYSMTLWLWSAAFIWWGWNVFARHFNLPQFSFMEIFAMRMGLTEIMRILLKKGGKTI